MPWPSHVEGEGDGCHDNTILQATDAAAAYSVCYSGFQHTPCEQHTCTVTCTDPPLAACVCMG